MMPTKAAYELFESSPDLEFEFYIADRLGCTLGELRERMPAGEYVQWWIFHSRWAQRKELEARKAAGR